MGLAAAKHTALMFQTNTVDDDCAQFVLNSEKGKNKVSDEKPDNLARIDVPR